MGNNVANNFTYAHFREDIPQLPGHSKELICALNKDHPDQVATGIHNGMDTLWQAFSGTVKRIPDNKFLGTRNVVDAEGNRTYSWKTFSQIDEIKEAFARALHYLGLCPKVEADGESYRFLGIIAKNREEWAISAIATMRSSVTIVPFYESLGAEAISHMYMEIERTKEAFSEDGWLCSGDVGMVLHNGAVKIIDRAKNIFKLSQGEYIAPEKLENI